MTTRRSPYRTRRSPYRTRRSPYYTRRVAGTGTLAALMLIGPAVGVLAAFLMGF